MLISELIKRLQEEQSKKGDIKVVVERFNDGEDGGTYSFEPVSNTFTFVNDKKQAESIVLCDAESFEGHCDNMDLQDEEILPAP